ncbi:hypothetical protein SAMN05421748_111128 [Paractinoplanes atraurantiacus]|uniref:Uncharacterized protein n=1 Tax=Paractinoplanes atraurantiacus TaxID=1036182 RepID=A0A285ISD1_9ACTN|nr:hypothetical protein SAMN05421748_111128 [Actinoplanes atraurantiacus]
MRHLRALLHAMRKRRSTDTDLAVGDPGLRRLIEAARAPATASELSGEKQMVDAFTAERKRAARAARRRRRPARIRAVLVPVTAGLALLLLTGTAVAARTGNLPQEAQQHAHRLFSALGVPAPRTGTPSPRESGSPSGPAPTPDLAAFTRCEAWRGAAPLSSHDRRTLIAAAGGEHAIGRYCEKVRQSASSPAKTAPPPAAPSAGTPSPAVPSPGVPSPGTPSPGTPSPAGPPSSEPPPKPSGPAHSGTQPPKSGRATPPSIATTKPAKQQPKATIPPRPSVAAAPTRVTPSGRPS